MSRQKNCKHKHVKGGSGGGEGIECVNGLAKSRFFLFFKLASRLLPPFRKLFPFLENCDGFFISIMMPIIE